MEVRQIRGRLPKSPELLCNSGDSGNRPRICLAVSFLLLIAPLLFAQTDTLSLTGTIFDANAKPVSSAHVHLEEPTAQRTWDSETRADGTFHFDRLMLGTYRITVNLQGYFETS